MKLKKKYAIHFIYFFFLILTAHIILAANQITSNYYVYISLRNEKNSSVSAYNLNGMTGTLSPFQTISTLPEDFNGKNTCADIHLTPDDRFLYASNRGHDSIAGYSIDPNTGKLTSLGQYATEKTPREFDIDPTGNFLFAAGESSDSLASYRINQISGELETLQVIYVGDRPAWILALDFVSP